MPFRFHSPAYASTVRLYHIRRTSQIFFLLPSRPERQCVHVYVCMYRHWWRYVIYGLRTVFMSSKSESHSNHKAEKTQMTHCHLLSASRWGETYLPATLSFSNIRTFTYKYVLRILCRKTLGLLFRVEQVPSEEANSSATRDKAFLACRSPEKLK